jgi:predicted metal-dependent HD superfamily phosphohydrolase
MFEFAFKSELSSITSDKNLIEKLWEEIREHYSQTGRYYHNLFHIDHIVSELQLIKQSIADWQTIIFSTAYHDIIYDPSQSNNEEESARFCLEKMSMLSLPHIQKEKCFDQIIATKTHMISVDSDTNIFTDADLAILGSEPAAYKHYALSIRKEYSFFQEVVYKAGRKKVLKYFLSLPFIYKTLYFRKKYESQAIENLSNELARI